MSPERYSPDDPREWLSRAKSNLAVAKFAANKPDILYEDLCFNCQQAAEKALKALLVFRKIYFPRTHDIAELLTLVCGSGINPPDVILESAKLTGYSVASRYPGLDEPIRKDEFSEAFLIAEQVIEWVSGYISKGD